MTNLLKRFLDSVKKDYSDIEIVSESENEIVFTCLKKEYKETWCERHNDGHYLGGMRHPLTGGYRRSTTRSTMVFGKMKGCNTPLFFTR